MASRSTDITVTFANAFAVGNTTGPQPAGSYRVTVDEDEIPSVFVVGYHRVATLFHTPAVGTAGPHQVFYVDVEDLNTAIRSDRRSGAGELVPA